MQAIPIPALGLLVWLLACPQAHADCPGPCETEAEVACWIARAACLSDGDRGRQAILELKQALRQQPESAPLARALAKTYLASGNHFWASRTLQTAIARDPSDCESRAWLAWVQLGQGYVDQARETLSVPPCPLTAEQAGRSELLKALIAKALEDPETQETARIAAGQTASLYPEDLRLLSSLDPDPGARPPLSAMIDLRIGYSSNAAAGAPMELTAASRADDIPSARMQLEAKLERNWNIGVAVQPSLMVSLRGLWFRSERAAGMGYWQPGGQLGLMVQPGLGELLVAYRYETLLVDSSLNPERGPDGRFNDAHLVNLEWDLPSLSLYATAGRRAFHQDDRLESDFGGSAPHRSRNEAELGAGGLLAISPGLNLLLAGSSRFHLAESEEYDLVGASLLGLLIWRPGLGFQIKASLSAGVDWYPNSDSEAGFNEFKWGRPAPLPERTDWVLRPGAAIWSPAIRGAQLGLTYDLAWRQSNVESDELDFDYLEHRVGLSLRWSFETDPQLPPTRTQADHVELDWGTSGKARGLLGTERIRDLMRQDENDRRGACGCSG